MALTFPNNPESFRAFFEELAGLHKAIQHSVEENRIRFFEIQYLDFPYSDWDMDEWDKSVGKNIKLGPNDQAMALLGFETADGHQAGFEVQASVLFFMLPQKVNSNAAFFAEKNRIFTATYNTCSDFRAVIRKYFRSNTQGYILPETFRTTHVRMPGNTNTMYGTRLDFTYGFYQTIAPNNDNWMEDPLA